MVAKVRSEQKSRAMTEGEELGMQMEKLGTGVQKLHKDYGLDRPTRVVLEA